MIKTVEVSVLFNVESSAVFCSPDLQKNRNKTLHNLFYVK